MSDAEPAKPKPAALAAAVNISAPYAWQILNEKRHPELGLALRIYRETAWRVPTLTGATEADIAVLERYQDAVERHRLAA